jgi:hypothetical protein
MVVWEIVSNIVYSCSLQFWFPRIIRQFQ